MPTTYDIPSTLEDYKAEVERLEDRISGLMETGLFESGATGDVFDIMFEHLRAILNGG